MVHVDWLTAWQEHADAPDFGHVLRVDFDPETGERVVERMLGENVEFPLNDDIPSRVSSIRVRSWGGVVEVSGNPSKWGRTEAVAGGLGLNESFEVYNSILRAEGLPEFTRFRAQVEGATQEIVRTGVRLRRVDWAGNLVCGSPGGRAAFFDWLPSRRFGVRGHRWGRGKFDGYLKAGTRKRSEVVTYDKAGEVDAAVMEWRRYGGRAISEVSYLQAVRDWCDALGLVRWEVRLYTQWLVDHGLGYWADWRDDEMGKVIWLQHEAPVAVEPGSACHWAAWADRLEGFHGEAKSKPLSRRQAAEVGRWVAAWMNGADAKDGLSRTTYMRRMKMVRDVLGIDMRERPDIRALSVAIRREVVLRPLCKEDLPEWYGLRPQAVSAARERPREVVERLLSRSDLAMPLTEAA